MTPRSWPTAAPARKPEPPQIQPGPQAKLVGGIEVFGIASITQLIAFLRGAVAAGGSD